MGPFGATFAPTAEAAAETKRANPLAGEQRAVKVLRFDLPTNPNNAPVANALLRPAPHIGGAQTPDRAVIASVLRALIGGDVSLPPGPAALTTTDSLRGWMDNERSLNDRTGAASVGGGNGESGALLAEVMHQSAAPATQAPSFSFGEDREHGMSGVPEPEPPAPAGPFGSDATAPHMSPLYQRKYGEEPF
jgi:hypothetical protein